MSGERMPVSQLPAPVQQLILRYEPRVKVVSIRRFEQPVNTIHPLSYHENNSDRMAVSLTSGRVLNGNINTYTYATNTSTTAPSVPLPSAEQPWVVVTFSRDAHDSRKLSFISVDLPPGIVGEPEKVLLSALGATLLYVLAHVRPGAYRNRAYEAAAGRFGGQDWRAVAEDELLHKGLMTKVRAGVNIGLKLTPEGEQVGRRLPTTFDPGYSTGLNFHPPQTWLGGLGGMQVGSTLGVMPRGQPKAVAQTIDSGSFANAAVAKAGFEPVRQALAEDSATTVPLGFEDYEAKYCQALKGGGKPPCRVHLTSMNGSTMAVRLCDKLNGEGTVMPVKDAAEALAVSKRFCKCSGGKPDAVRKKCARKVAGS